MWNREIIKTLTQATDICKERGRRSYYEAYNILVHFLARELRITQEPLKLDNELYYELQKLNLLELLRSDLNDHLGGLFVSLELNNKRAGQCFTPPHVADLMCKMTGVSESKPGEKIFDPCCGTGIFLVTALKYINPGVMLFGIDIDVTVYRACLVNMRIYSQYNPFYILCGDALVQEYDWTKANRW